MALWKYCQQLPSFKRTFYLEQAPQQTIDAVPVLD